MMSAAHASPRRSPLLILMRKSTVAASLLLSISVVSAISKTITPGEALYLEEILPSGAPVTGGREGEGSATGADAACVNAVDWDPRRGQWLLKACRQSRFCQR
jgi:hypothetical protein